jgi:hypothetical protein
VDRKPVRIMASPSWPVLEGQLIKETAHARYVEKYGDAPISFFDHLERHRLILGFIFFTVLSGKA